MSEDPRFEKLEQLAYQKLFGPDSTAGATASRMVGDAEDNVLLDMAKDFANQKLIASLVEAGENETLALMAIESAYERRREEALEGKLDYAAWLGAVSQNLNRCGTPILVLGVISAIVAIAAMYALSQAVPAGERVRISYFIASILAGGAAFIVGSIPVYSRLHRRSTSSSGDSSEV